MHLAVVIDPRADGEVFEAIRRAREKLPEEIYDVAAKALSTKDPYTAQLCFLHDCPFWAPGRRAMITLTRKELERAKVAFAALNWACDMKQKDFFGRPQKAALEAMDRLTKAIEACDRALDMLPVPVETVR